MGEFHKGSVTMQLLSLACRAAAEHHTLPFMGWIVRGAIGRAAHTLGCSCGQHAEHRVDCGFAALFDSADPRWRLDASELDGRWLRPGDPWRLRIVGFGADVALLADAALRALGDGLGEDRVPHAVESVDIFDDYDPLDRGGALVGRTSVAIVTPADLRRDGRPLDVVTPLDLLHGVRHRVRALDLPVSLPRFEDTVNADELWAEQCRGARWSAERTRWEPVVGVRSTWNWTLTPAQAAWVALAEATGVGKHGTAGMGVVRCAR